MHCRFFLAHPIQAKPIRNNIEPTGKLVGVLECWEFFVDLEEGVLRNFFGVVKITYLPPCKRVHALFVFMD